MLSKTVCCFIVFVVLSQSSLFSQERLWYDFHKIEQPQDAPHYEVALANMASDFLEESRIIIFVKVINDELQFIKSKGKTFQADYEISVVITDSSGLEIDSKKKVERVFAQNFDDVNSLELFHVSQLSLNLSPIAYSFKIGLKDLETRRTSYQEGAFTLHDFSATDLLVSDLIYLDSLNVEKKEISTINAYFEIYNVPEKDSMKVNFAILDELKEIKFSSAEWIVSEGRITPIHIDIKHYEQVLGSKLVKITISARDTSLAVEKKPITFYRVNPYYDYSDIENAIEKLIYIAKDDEMKKLKKSEGEEQIEEFKKFWEKRDPTPGTPHNEYLEEYYRRIEFASKNIESGREGWKTDMGLVFVKLGSPDYIEKPIGYELYDRTSRYRPPVLWHYSDISRRVYFVYRGGEYRIENYSDVYDVLNDEMRF